MFFANSAVKGFVFPAPPQEIDNRRHFRGATPALKGRGFSRAFRTQNRSRL
jgi:hypothetical protein